MARYTADSKEKVRDAVNILDLVGQYTELRKAGPVNYKGLCPFHDERTPSFNVNADEKFYKCFGCGAGGDVYAFVMEKEGLDFVGALERLAERYGVELEWENEDPAAARARARQARLTELLRRTADFYVRHLWESPEAAGAREYLAGRGLDEQLLREFRVGYAPRKWDAVLIPSRQAGYSEQELLDAGLVIRSQQAGRRPYDRFRARITFPLCDRRGHVMGFGARRLADDDTGPKYLNSNDGPLFHKGKNVYASDIARVHAAKAGTVILAEGYTDVIALHQAGLRNTVGLMGTALTPDQVTELARLAPVVVLALDADSAGQEAMLRAARVAEGRNVQLRVVRMPAGQDPADVVQEQGGDAMRRLVEQSIPFVSFRVHQALAQADLHTAEGKDAAFDDLRPLFAGLTQGALREELVRIVASATDRPASVIARDLAAAPVAPAARRPVGPPPGGASARGPAAAGGRPVPVAQAAPRQAAVAAARPAAPTGVVAAVAATAAPPPPARSAPAGDGWEGMEDLEPDPTTYEPGDGARPALTAPAAPSAAPGAPAAHGGNGTPPAPAALPTPSRASSMPDGPLARVERAFLIQVVGQPALGRPALVEVGGPDAFIPGVHQRAAAHLLTVEGSAMAGLDDADAGLTSLMAGLVIRAGEQTCDASTLAAEGLKLRLARVERRIQQAEKADVPALARERLGLQRAVADAIARHMESGA